MEPMDMAEQMQGDPDAAGEGYEICIAVSKDGRVAVGVESGSYEAAEEQGAQEAGMEKPEMRQVQGIQEAIRMAMDIYKANGQMPEGPSEEGTRGFEEGFSE
jgi:hypothetical protein